MAMARLGKDVVDLLGVSVSFGDKQVLRDVEWRIGPGERSGILGVNGAGKSTLLALVTGELAPTAGRVKRGKTIRVAALDQQLAALEDFGGDRVSEIIGRRRTTYVAGGKELTPGQLLERLGFTSAQLSTPAGDLSGGQRRRLQLLLVLLDEPNVLILDEPTNDMDVDMLAAFEDLLDSWPGTLLAVSHDRYFLERVTDQQYAIIDGHLRHLPGGVDQYLAIQAERAAGVSGSPPVGGTVQAGGRAGDAGAEGDGESGTGLSGADLRAAHKEIAAIDRKLAKLADRIDAAHAAIAAHDQSDYLGLTEKTSDLDALQAEVAKLETRWLEISELIG
jgi:ABC-type multidrug transport system ATPase subunit